MNQKKVKDTANEKASKAETAEPVNDIGKVGGYTGGYRYKKDENLINDLNAKHRPEKDKKAI